MTIEYSTDRGKRLAEERIKRHIEEEHGRVDNDPLLGFQRRRERWEEKFRRGNK